MWLYGVWFWNLIILCDSMRNVFFEDESTDIIHVVVDTKIHDFLLLHLWTLFLSFYENCAHRLCFSFICKLRPRIFSAFLNTSYKLEIHLFHLYIVRVALPPSSYFGWAHLGLYMLNAQMLVTRHVYSGQFLFP